MILPIVTGADQKILRTVSKPVTIFDKSIKKLAKDMVDTMLGEDDAKTTGIGLAANQIGKDIRIMIVTFNVHSKKNHKIVAMVNPEITWMSEHTVVMEEGCLSLPKVFGDVRRPSKVKARWQTPEGNWCEKKLAGWDARIFQHELDHLDGKLFIDYL